MAEYLPRLVTAFGETKNIKKWSKDKRCKVAYTTLYRRVITMGESVETALSEGPRPNTKPRPMSLCHPDRPHAAKGMCKWCYAVYFERLKGPHKAWKLANPVKFKNICLKSRYGISLEDAEAIKKAQNYLCPICGSAELRDIDHDHSTGKVRGVLCGPCNRGLGHFRDNIAALRKAAEYIEGVKNACG